MAQVPNTREKFKEHLVDANKMVEELIEAKGVMIDSALYGLLQAASYALSTATTHWREYYVEGEISNQE